MQDVIENIEPIVVQIATPYSTGTGVYLGEHSLIITNEHVVRNFNQVVVSGDLFEKQLLNILLIDQKFDIAIIEAPKNHNMPVVPLDSNTIIREGDQVIAAGHPFDLKFTTTQGIISSTLHHENDIDFYQHDAALNPGNSGGPLISSEGRIIAINSFIFQKGQSIGFSLPAKYVTKIIEEYIKGNGAKAVRCQTCEKISFEDQHHLIEYCQKCGAEITYLTQIPSYEPHGISHTIETLIASLGYDVALTRKGPYNWQIQKGSAMILVSYYEKSGMLVGDVVLCGLPDEGIHDTYLYLLTQNYKIDGFTFSIRGKDIILSMLVFDQFLKQPTLFKLFSKLIEAADNFDDQIITRFGGNIKK